MKLLKKAAISLVAFSWLFYGLIRDLEDVRVVSHSSDKMLHADLNLEQKLTAMSLNINHISRGNDSFPKGSSEVYKVAISMFRLFKNPGRLETNLKGLSEMITSEQPDILGIQEADYLTPEAGYWDSADRLAKINKYDHLVWGHGHSLMIGPFPWLSGNAILSKYPIIEARNIVLNEISSSKPSTWCYQFFGTQTSLEADIDINGKIIRVMNTHLKSGTRLINLPWQKKRDYAAKKEQVEKLIERINASPYPVILIGDLNSSKYNERSNDPTMKLLETYVKHEGFPDHYQIDHILLRKTDNLEYVDKPNYNKSDYTDHNVVKADIILIQNSEALIKYQ